MVFYTLMGQILNYAKNPFETHANNPCVWSVKSKKQQHYVQTVSLDQILKVL